MSVLRARRAREFAQLQAAGWTVTTVTPWDRLRAVRQDNAGRAQERLSAPVARRPGWLR